MPVLGNRIKEVRLALGLSQQQLAGNSLTRSFISLIEQGKAQPSPETLAFIAKRLDKAPAYFQSDVEDSAIEAVKLLERATDRYIADHNWNDAISHATTALGVADRAGRPAVQLRLHMKLGVSLLGSRDYWAALEIYEGMVEECRFLDDRASLAEVYYRIGMSSQMLEDYYHAVRGYEHAVRLANEKKSLLELKAFALVKLGSCHCTLGQIDKAIEAYKQSMEEILPSEYPYIYGVAWHGLSICLRKGQLWHEAREYACRALDTFERINHQESADVRHGLAIIQMELGDLDEAFDQLCTCGDVYQQTDESRLQAGVLSSLSLYHLKTYNPAAAIRLCEEALNLLDLHDDGLLRGILYRRLAQAHLGQGNPRRAKELLRISLDLLRRIRANAEAEETAALLLECASRSCNAHAVRMMV